MRATLVREFGCAVIVCLALLLGSIASAAHRGPATVPPTLEIEVLDPGVDPVGNPAVFLQADEWGQLQVDIPPVVLVHRYYYSGDRSFQAQLLPGGPSIVVANHPKTGERCYIPVQMMPGAPRVTYTKNSIEYDYGEHGTTIHFGLFGKPTVKYRNGQPLVRKVGHVVHAEQWKEHAQHLHGSAQTAASRCKTLTCGAVVEIGQAGNQLLLPVKNVLRVLPGGAVLMGTDWEERFATRAAEHRRDNDIRHLEKDQRWSEYSIPTNR
jgi:hypothetical protein